MTILHLQAQLLPLILHQQQGAAAELPNREPQGVPAASSARTELSDRGPQEIHGTAVDPSELSGHMTDTRTELDGGFSGPEASGPASPHAEVEAPTGRQLP